MLWTRQEVSAAPASCEVPAGGQCPLLACMSLFMHLFPGACPWSNLMAILEQRNGADTELLVFTMTLINKVCEGVPVVPHCWGSVWVTPVPAASL